MMSKMAQNVRGVLVCFVDGSVRDRILSTRQAVMDK